jgi:ADP-ribosyl-[dinitrogen reductase] hydrolase
VRVVDLADRVSACVLGLALGDALGAPFEFRRSSDVPEPLPAFGLPWMGSPPGTTTDDTAMARNLVRSLAARGGFDAEDLAARHVAWYRSDPPDIGNQTRLALAAIARGEPVADASRRVFERRGPEVSAGNGSVMYCAPLGAAYANRPGELSDLAPRLSAITHHDGRCRTAVLAVTVAVAALVRGRSRPDALAAALEAAADRDGGEELEFLVESAGTVRPVDGPDQGFCLFAAGLGLQTLTRDQEFEPELRRVVGLGGDTDTNGAVAGAILGAALGRAGLPGGWLARLKGRNEIEREAAGLTVLAASTA